MGISQIFSNTNNVKVKMPTANPTFYLVDMTKTHTGSNYLTHLLMHLDINSEACDSYHFDFWSSTITSDDTLLDYIDTGDTDFEILLKDSQNYYSMTQTIYVSGWMKFSNITVTKAMTPIIIDPRYCSKYRVCNTKSSQWFTAIDDQPSITPIQKVTIHYDSPANDDNSNRGTNVQTGCYFKVDTARAWRTYTGTVVVNDVSSTDVTCNPMVKVTVEYHYGTKAYSFTRTVTGPVDDEENQTITDTFANNSDKFCNTFVFFATQGNMYDALNRKWYQPKVTIEYFYSYSDTTGNITSSTQNETIVINEKEFDINTIQETPIYFHPQYIYQDNGNYYLKLYWTYNLDAEIYYASSQLINQRMHPIVQFTIGSNQTTLTYTDCTGKKPLSIPLTATDLTNEYVTLKNYTFQKEYPNVNYIDYIALTDNKLPVPTAVDIKIPFCNLIEDANHEGGN